MHLQSRLQSRSIPNQLYAYLLRHPTDHYLSSLLWNAFPALEVSLLCRRVPTESPWEKASHTNGGSSCRCVCRLLASYSNGTSFEKLAHVPNHGSHGCHSDHIPCARLHELLRESDSVRFPLRQLSQGVSQGDPVQGTTYAARTSAKWLSKH